MKKASDIVNVTFTIERVDGVNLDLVELVDNIVGFGLDNGIFYRGLPVENEVDYHIQISPSVELS